MQLGWTEMMTLVVTMIRSGGCKLKLGDVSAGSNFQLNRIFSFDRTAHRRVLSPIIGENLFPENTNIETRFTGPNNERSEEAGF